MRIITYVAELGSMHKRDKGLAYEMMRQAKLAGATIAKFQFGWPKEDKVRYVDDWARDIAHWSKEIGIEWMASIFSLDGLSAARSVGMQKYKVAHQIALDKEQVPLITNIIAEGKPVYISGDIMTYRKFRPPNVSLIYVEPGKYPNYNPSMPKKFIDWHGYSSHVHGVGDALLAISHGALYIEKHFTLDKTDLWVRDTAFAVTPDEFKDMVRYGDTIARALGNKLT